MVIGSVPELKELNEFCPDLSHQEKIALIEDAEHFAYVKQKLETTEQRLEAWDWPITKLGVALINHNIDSSRPIFWRQALYSKLTIKKNYKEFIRKTLEIINVRMGEVCPQLAFA
jgi:hypothetical protein